ncbi:hypothetical protein ENBRE01_0995 [Enteropsectra breve]|nr:hypothetical protein ENBRE01_0995 [Enteropsectra breve]
MLSMHKLITNAAWLRVFSPSLLQHCRAIQMDHASLALLEFYDFAIPATTEVSERTNTHHSDSSTNNLDIGVYDILFNDLGACANFFGSNIHFLAYLAGCECTAESMPFHYIFKEHLQNKEFSKARQKKVEELVKKYITAKYKLTKLIGFLLDKLCDESEETRKIFGIDFSLELINKSSEPSRQLYSKSYFLTSINIPIHYFDGSNSPSEMEAILKDALGHDRKVLTRNDAIGIVEIYEENSECDIYAPVTARYGKSIAISYTELNKKQMAKDPFPLEFTLFDNASSDRSVPYRIKSILTAKSKDKGGREIENFESSKPFKKDEWMKIIHKKVRSSSVCVMYEAVE